jgi:catalase
MIVMNNKADGLGWKERYIGGSAEAEDAFITQAIKDIHEMQEANQKESHSATVKRGFHAKIHAGITNAEFRIAANLPPQLRGGFFTAGKTYPTTVRFSNAGGRVRPDSEKDLRGIALRVETENGMQDFLATNGIINHVHDAKEFIDFGKIMTGNKWLILLRLILRFGIIQIIQMFIILFSQVGRRVASLATENYFSRAPFAFNGYAFKFQLSPSAGTMPVCGESKSDNYLREELVDRLKKGPVVFDFQVQFFKNEQETSIEDGTCEWKTPLITVAQLVIPQQDLTTPEAAAIKESVDKLEFNPWHCVDGMVPLGNANRARRLVYEASAELRRQ